MTFSVPGWITLDDKFLDYKIGGLDEVIFKIHPQKLLNKMNPKRNI